MDTFSDYQLNQSLLMWDCVLFVLIVLIYCFIGILVISIV